MGYEIVWKKACDIMRAVYKWEGGWKGVRRMERVGELVNPSSRHKWPRCVLSKPEKQPEWPQMIP